MCHLTPAVELPLAIDLRAAAAARAFLRSEACQEHVTAPVDNASLLVSELVSNAVRHGRPPVVVGTECEEDTLKVWVRDGGPDLPKPRHSPPDDVGGRGLMLIDALSQDWGIDEVPGGKQVWFVVPLH